MIVKLTLTVFLLCAAMCVAATAQTNPDAEKQAAIKEYLAVMNENVKVGDIMNATDAQMTQMARELFASMSEKNKTLSPDEHREIEEMLFNPQTGYLKRFHDKVFSRLDMEKLVEDLTYKIYDKHFTTAEIKEMTAFYRTPTGQKLLKSMPEIMQESLAGMFEQLVPKMKEINDDLTKELTREIETKTTELLAKRKKQNNKIQ